MTTQSQRQLMELVYAEKTPPETERSKVAFHMGDALIRIAATYRDVVSMLLEQIQNALDADAKIIHVVLNQKKRCIAIRDNGKGFSRERFERDLQNICHSEKKENQMGEFGIGVISPIGKCRYSTITSFDPSTLIARTWRFELAKIIGQSEVDFPCIVRNDLFHSKVEKKVKGKKWCWWRTQVEVYEYTPDQNLSRIGSVAALKETILQKFNNAMRRHKTKITLLFVDESGNRETQQEDFVARPYDGKQLPIVKIHEKDAGEVTFQLYLSPDMGKGRKGTVQLGVTGRDYRFSSSFLAGSTRGYLDKRIIDDLRSGIFEGEITAEKCTLRAERFAFERDDAWAGLLLAINQWYRDYGKAYIEEIREQQQDERYQQLGLESLRTIASMLDRPEFADLKAVTNQFSSEIPSAEQTSDPGHGVETIRPPREGKSSGENTAGTAPDREKRPRESGFGVQGPKGRRGKTVQKDSFGLRFAHHAMDGQDILWSLDTKHGVLSFNISHPLWVAADDASGQKIRRLQETVAIHALLIEVMPHDMRDDLTYAFDMQMKMLLSLYSNSSAFNPLKKPKSEPGEEETA